MLVVSTVIVSTFILFNVIPDFVFAFVEWNDRVYHVLTFLWSIGYISDPLVYIFLSKNCRKVNLYTDFHLRLPVDGPDPWVTNKF